MVSPVYRDARGGGAKDAVVAFRLRRRNSFGFTWALLHDACVLGRAMMWRGTEDNTRSTSEPIASDTSGADNDGAWCGRCRVTKNPTRRAFRSASRACSSFS